VIRQIKELEDTKDRYIKFTVQHSKTLMRDVISDVYPKNSQNTNTNAKRALMSVNERLLNWIVGTTTDRPTYRTSTTSS